MFADSKDIREITAESTAVTISILFISTANNPGVFLKYRRDKRLIFSRPAPMASYTLHRQYNH